MNRLKNIGLVLCGLALGLSLSVPAAQAVESLKATLSTNRILVDGQEVRLTAYNINGNNYVMLRDVGRAHRNWKISCAALCGCVTAARSRRTFCSWTAALRKKLLRWLSALHAGAEI